MSTLRRFSRTEIRRVLRSAPWLTTLFIVACTVTYFFLEPRDPVVPGPDRTFLIQWAFIPCEAARGRPLDSRELAYAAIGFKTCSRHPHGAIIFPGKHVYLASLVSMFLHSDRSHLFFNMLGLAAVGRGLERAAGRLAFLGVCVLAQTFASILIVALFPSATSSVIGASTVVMAAVGAHLTLLRGAKVLGMPWGLVAGIVALAVLIEALSGSSQIVNVAHLGGLAFGAAAGVALLRMQVPHKRARLA